MPGARRADTSAERLYIAPRSVLIAVGLLGFALLALRVLGAAERVIGWMLVAVTVAGLLHPVVRWFGRKLPYGLSVFVVAMLSLGVVAAVTYRVVDDVRSATDRLQEAAPAAALEVEESERFGEFARSIDLAERTERFVEAVPVWLRGGEPADALRTAATRGVAFLTTSVLTLFLLLHGPRIARAALDQIPDRPGPRGRERAERVARRAYERSFGYARGTLLMAVLAGTLMYGAARAADVPGAAALGVWGALWDVVPFIGAVIGGAPIVALAAVADPMTGALLAGLLIAYQVVEDVVIEPALERSTMRLGPFLTLVGGLIGVELRGATGAVLAVVVFAFAAAVVDELADQPRYASSSRSTRKS